MVEFLTSKPVIHMIATGILAHRATLALPDAIYRMAQATKNAYKVAHAEAAEYAAQRAAAYAAKCRQATQQV